MAPYRNDSEEQDYYASDGYYPEERTLRTTRSSRNSRAGYPEKTVAYSAGSYRGSRGKRRKRRGNRTLLFTFALMAVAGIAVLIVHMIFNRRETFIEMNETPIETDCTYLNTGDGLLYQTDGEIHFYHFSDSKKNYTYGM